MANEETVIVDTGNDEERAKAGINAGLAGAANEIVQQFGSAAKEHFVAYSGVDNEAGQTLQKGLKSISESKINSEYRSSNIKQQAGFSAEVKATARENAERIIQGDNTRVTRTDDLGRINDPLYDHVELDASGNVIQGSGSQMKFVGSTSKKALDKLMSQKYQKYVDNGVPFEVPSDYYDGIINAADERIQSLRQQLDASTARGDNALADKQRAQIEKLEKIKGGLKKSNLTNAEAIEARLNPGWSTAKDVVNISLRAGVEQAKTGTVIGGGISFIRNAAALISGEKTVDVAVVDLVKDTGGAAAVSFATGAGGSVIKSAMQNAPSEFLQTLSKTGLPSTIVVTAWEAVKTLIKWGNGEIDGMECLEELGEKGTGMLAGAAGSTMVAGAALSTFGKSILIGQLAIPIPIVGGLIGGMIGFAFSSLCYRSVMDAFKDAKLAREERIRIEAECEEARAQLREYHAQIQTIINNYLTEHRTVFDEAFRDIQIALDFGDDDLYIRGMNDISEQLGGTPQFADMTGFEQFMASDEPFKL